MAQTNALIVTLRLDQVCQMVGIEITNLVQAMKEDSQGQIRRLSETQEEEIVSDLELLLVTESYPF